MEHPGPFRLESSIACVYSSASDSVRFRMIIRRSSIPAGIPQTLPRAGERAYRMDGSRDIPGSPSFGHLPVGQSTGTPFRPEFPAYRISCELPINTRHPRRPDAIRTCTVSRLSERTASPYPSAQGQSLPWRLRRQCREMARPSTLQTCPFSPSCGPVPAFSPAMDAVRPSAVPEPASDTHRPSGFPFSY